MKNQNPNTVKPQLTFNRLAHRNPDTPAKDGDTLIVLFGGGTKRGQQRDIDKAKELLAEYKLRKKAMASKTGNKHKG